MFSLTDVLLFNGLPTLQPLVFWVVTIASIGCFVGALIFFVNREGGKALGLLALAAIFIGFYINTGG